MKTLKVLLELYYHILDYNDKPKDFKHWPMILDLDKNYDEHEELRDLMEVTIKNTLTGLERDILVKQLYEYEEITLQKRGKPSQTIRIYKQLKDICAELGKDPKTIRKYMASGEAKLKAYFHSDGVDTSVCAANEQEGYHVTQALSVLEIRPGKRCVDCGVLFKARSNRAARCANCAAKARTESARLRKKKQRGTNVTL